MGELLYNIEEVFGSYMAPGQYYNIPEYQRGYKWKDQQVVQLLEDIAEFNPSDEDDIFYCLQNITIVHHAENDRLNIVDGQQRLTTIGLILSYLHQTDKVKNKIVYSVREPSNDFLQSIISDRDGILDKIKENDDFEDFVTACARDYDYQDIYFMYSAIRAIDCWFLNKTQNSKPIDKEKFTNKFLHNVKLIVNRITGISEQELFMNLNAGRVQLDGSDLVRAILITRVAKQEMEELDPQEIKGIVILNERRIRIGWELDEINAWWSHPAVYDYFSAFTSLKTAQKETIKFNEKVHPINLLYKIWAESKGEPAIKLNLFEPQNTQALDLYHSIIRLHRILKDWFEDREIYHYLGFLFAQSKIKFKMIWDEWDSKDYPRSKFISFLLKEIRETIFGNEPIEDNLETGIFYWLGKIRDYNSDKLEKPV